MRFIHYVFCVLLLSLFACDPGPGLVDAGPKPVEEGPTAAREGALAELMARKERVAKIRSGGHATMVTPRATQLSTLARWRAEGSPTPKLQAAGSSATTPIYPAAWSTGTWYVDDQNVSGTASDLNDCQTPTTACRTCQEIVVHRWGTSQPALQNPVGTSALVVMNYLSASPNDTSDSCAFDPIGGFFQLNGPLTSVQQVASGVLGATFHAKNAATRQVLNVQLPAPTGTYSAGELIVNNTHSSSAYLTIVTSGTSWNVSQPADRNTGNEVNTWAVGDSVVVYKMAGLQFRYMGVNTGYSDVAASNQLDDYTDYGFCFEATAPGGTFSNPRTFQNCDLPEGSYTLPDPALSSFEAGQYRGGNVIQGALFVTEDFVVASSGNGIIFTGQTSVIDTLWLQTGFLEVLGTAKIRGGAPDSGTFITGTGTSGILVFPGATFVYPSWDGGATGTFLQAGPMRYVLHTTGYALAGSALCPGITVSPANLDQPTNPACDGGFGGAALDLQTGAAYTNTNH